MTMEEFQEQLKILCDLAEKNEQKLTNEQIKEHFVEADLDTKQLVEILEYLKKRGITIISEEQTQNDGKGIASERMELEEVHSRHPLSSAQETYLKEYLETLESKEENPSQAQALFARLNQRDTSASKELIEYYMPLAAHMAADMICDEIRLEDLIQEANLALVTALSDPQPAYKDDTWLRLTLRKGIIAAVEAQTQRKFEDDQLVGRVEKLDKALKELEDEDGLVNFTVNELTILLDMSVDELKDVLRLTGDVDES